eukprot:scaffold1_cov375-Pavlova_lutheri.AAC.6
MEVPPIPQAADYEVLHVQGTIRLRCLDLESCQSKGHKCRNTTLHCYPTRLGPRKLIKKCFEKAVKLYKMMHSVIAVLKDMGRELPDCRLPLALGSMGHESNEVACIAKSNPNYGCFLVPNPYFADLYQWEKKEGEAATRNTKWEEKQGNVFYRGACRIDYDKYGSLQRFNLMSLRDDVLDVGWTRNTGTVKCIRSFTDEPNLLQHHLNIIKTRVQEDEFSRHKFLVNMPGSTRGSYSRHLQKLWNKGSIVLVWESEAQEWYYKKLVEGFTHLTVNEHTIVPVVKEVLSLPWTEQQRLITSAQGVFENLLSKEGIALRWYEAFQHFCAPDTPVTLDDGQCLT